MSIISKSVINLATKTVTNLINSNPSSRRTTVGEIVAAVNYPSLKEGAWREAKADLLRNKC